MAERRMFAKTIIDSDAFLDMPITARLLYYDLAMRADDDGFVNAPKKIMRMVGASQDDLSILALRKFIIPFEIGVIVIKHWKIHNYIKNDRYKPTTYQSEKAMLKQGETGEYISLGTEMEPVWNQNGTEMDTQVRLGKDSIGKDSINISCPPAEPDGRVSNPKKLNNLDFDLCWKEYPNKKGKDKITKKALAELDKLGTEKVLEAVRRYKAECEADKRDTQYIQHGSTFFCGGYKDYIGDDYQPPQRRNGDGLPVYDDYDIPF